MRSDYSNWSPKYQPRDDDEVAEDESNAYTVVWLMGRDDGTGVIKQTHVYAPNMEAASHSVWRGELRSCEGFVITTLRGHLQGGS